MSGTNKAKRKKVSQTPSFARPTTSSVQKTIRHSDPLHYSVDEPDVTHSSKKEDFDVDTAFFCSGSSGQRIARKQERPLQENVFRIRLDNFLAGVRDELALSREIDSINELASRSSEDRARSIYRCLNVPVISATALSDTHSPLPKIPESEVADHTDCPKKGRRWSTSKERDASDSACGVSVSIECPSTPPRSPQPLQRSPFQARSPSLAQTLTEEALRISPKRIAAEDIDIDSATEDDVIDRRRVRGGINPPAPPLICIPDEPFVQPQHCPSLLSKSEAPTLATSDVDIESEHLEFKAFKAARGSNASLNHALFSRSDKLVPCLHHDSDPAQFITWISKINVFESFDSPLAMSLRDSLSRDLLDAVLFSSLEELVRGVVVDTLVLQDT